MALAGRLATLDALGVAVLTDDVSDNYVSKTPFAVSEFSNVVRGGVSVISGEALLCANLGFGLKLVSYLRPTLGRRSIKVELLVRGTPNFYELRFASRCSPRRPF